MFTLDPALFRPDAVSAETAAFNRDLAAKLAEGPALHEVAPEITRAARAAGEGITPVGGPREGSDWRAAPTGAGRVRISLPEGRPRGVYLHIHGGGWTIGAPDQNDERMQFLAAEAGCACVSIGYRLSPEHPWPAPAEDCADAAAWALEALAAEFGTDRFAIGGESAGAHLAVVTLLKLREKGLGGRIAGALLTYGLFDLRLSPSAANWGARNMILSTPTVDWFAENLTAGDRALRGDPLASPILADLAGMPPALFICGTNDPLLDDTLFMAQRWLAAGAGAALNLYPGGVHAFDLFDLAIAREARAAGAAFLREIFTA